MNAHTFEFSPEMPALDGHAHISDFPLADNSEEITLNNLGNRIVVILGNSRQKVGKILIPGVVDEISDTDIARMELAIREPFLHENILFGDKGAIPIFRATREKASSTIGVRYTPELLDAERRLELLFEIHGRSLYEKSDMMDTVHGLERTVSVEEKKSVHIWDEITRNLYQTTDGRKLFRQLRPLYLERQKKREEAELQEFHSIDVLFQGLLSEIQPSQIFVGTPINTGRHEIYARHILKLAGNSDPSLSGPVRDISGSSVTINLRNFTADAIDFEV